MLAEVRQSMLLARLRAGMLGASHSNNQAQEILTARQALEIATRGSASVLGRQDVGQLAVGKCADFFAVNLNRIGYAGALHDPVAAVVFCAPVQADYTAVGGRWIVKDGQLVPVEAGMLVEQHQKAARRLLSAI
jgi:8-oxoguanine deaminase